MLPLCSLRPIKENNGCRFAYPLYSRKLKTADSQCELVPFEESDGLTSAGIEIALREGGWIRVMNKSGRQSLGCMLGMSAMPNLCASYPVAPELSQVDFWHVRRSFWRKRRAASKPLSCGHSTEENSISTSEVGLRLASGWQYEENYVISRDNLCEGFGAQSCIENQTIHSFLSKAIAPSSEKQTTTESLSTLERWEESQWFYALLEDISSFLPMELITNKSIQLTLVNRLALIWYNFDSLSSSKSRPIKSYRRLKKDIETLTWILIKETKKFLENMTTSTSDSNDPLCEAEVSISYENLLQRLHVN